MEIHGEGDLRLYKLGPLGPYENNAYVIHDHESQEALVANGRLQRLLDLKMAVRLPTLPAAVAPVLPAAAHHRRRRRRHGHVELRARGGPSPVRAVGRGQLRAHGSIQGARIHRRERLPRARRAARAP